MKRKVEVFTAGCPVCEPVVDLVKKTACSACAVTVYNLSEKELAARHGALIKQYGVNRVPAIVVDGQLLNCCQTGRVTEQDLLDAGIGQPL